MNPESVESVESVEIKNRMLCSSKSSHSKHYIAKEKNNEIGFISLDERPNVDYLVLYELFVVSCQRRKGYGRLLLSKIELIGKKKGYCKVMVNPEPFEGNLPKEQLISFYMRNGFSETLINQNELEKIID